MRDNHIGVWLTLLGERVGVVVMALVSGGSVTKVHLLQLGVVGEHLGGPCG